MKQYITKKQLLELSEEQGKKLRNWYYDKRKIGDKVLYHHPINPNLKNKVLIFGEDAMQGDPSPLMSIGQMIEFIEYYYQEMEIYKIDYSNEDEEDVDIRWFIGNKPYLDGYSNKELCDALWEAVKNLLING
jgi:hypothetical protein